MKHLTPFSPAFDAALAESRARREAFADARAKSGAAFNQVPLDGGALGLTSDRMRRPFAECPHVFAAVRHIARPIASVPLEFYRADGGSESPVNDPRLAAFWRRPSRQVSSFAEFVLASVGWRKLAGECFWLLDDTALVPFPEVRAQFPPLILARPDQMRHVADGSELTGWEFTAANGRRQLLLPEQVVQLKQWNPYDDFRGLGDFEAARLAAETETANGRFQLSLAQSNGDQGVYVVAKAGLPDDAQKTQIIAQLREKRALQQRGVFKPIFLSGDITVEDPKVRAVDAAFLAGSALNAERIFLAFGVPPSMAGKLESYSIGSASDYYRLILDTCLPESRELCAGINQVIARLTGLAVEAECAWDHHPVMQETRKESLDSFGKLCDRGMPAQAAGNYLDLGLPRFAGDDVGYLPFSVAPVGRALPENDPTLQAPADPVTEALRALRSRRAVPVYAKATARETAEWRTHMAQRRPTTRDYESAFGRVLFAARAEVLRKLENHATAERSRMPQDGLAGLETPTPPPGAGSRAFKRELNAMEPSTETRSGAIDFLFDLETFRTGLAKAFAAVGRVALNTAGKQLFAELGKDDPFIYPPARAIQFLRERALALAEVPQEVTDRIRAVIEDGLNAGDPLQVIAKLVRGEFNDLSEARARTIAATETSAAYGVARQEGMTQAGVRWKEWLTSGAENVRPTHAAANGQTVAADEHFTVGGEQLLHPCDPHGRAGNVINCHCVAIAVATGPEEAV